MHNVVFRSAKERPFVERKAAKPRCFSWTGSTVYEQLRRLSHEESKTRAAGTMDDDGRFACRGFLGKYRLEIQVPGGKVEREFRLTKDRPPEIVVRLVGH